MGGGAFLEEMEAKKLAEKPVEVAIAPVTETKPEETKPTEEKS